MPGKKDTVGWCPQNCVSPYLGGYGKKFYSNGSRRGFVDKDLSVCRAYIPLIWTQVVSWWASVVLEVIKLGLALWNEDCFIRWLEPSILGVFSFVEEIKDIKCIPWGTLMAEGLKSLLMKVKEESEKLGLKLSIQKAKIMASGPITSWQIDGETMEKEILFLGGLKNHCRWWLQPWN